MLRHVPCSEFYRRPVRCRVPAPGAVSQGTVIEDFRLLSFTFAELLFVCLFAMEKG